jgi:hypothetical protein
MKKWSLLLSLVVGALFLQSCGGGAAYAGGSATLTIGVLLSESTTTVQAGATTQVTATVSNDSAGKGVTWTVSCSAVACGSVSPTSTPSGMATTYAAPPTPPANNLKVTLTAAAAADPTKTAWVVITVPAITVSSVVVSCPGQSLSAAVAALPPGPNTITVTGTCSNENVVINNMRSLSIIAGAAGAKIVQAQDSDTFDISLSQDIDLQGLEIAGVPGSTLGSGGAGVHIDEASDAHIDGCNIDHNEGDGIYENGGSQLFLSNSNIHDNPLFGSGIEVFNNSIAYVSGTTIQNNGSAGAVTGHGIGVEIARESNVVFSQMNLIQNNGDIGITVSLVSTVAFQNGTGTTIQGHNIVGINVSEGAHLQDNGPLFVQGNGLTCSPGGLIPCGGIAWTKNSTLELSAGTISGNHGAGIDVGQGANVDLTAQFGGVTVSNNSGDGVAIRLNSIGDFRPLGDSTNTITGNGGASISWDNRSLAVGNLTGFTNVTCTQTVPN